MFIFNALQTIFEFYRGTIAVFFNKLFFICLNNHRKQKKIKYSVDAEGAFPYSSAPLQSELRRKLAQTK